MRQIFGVLLVVAVAMSGAFRAQAQNGSKELVLDVYSVKVPSDVVQEKGFELWRESLYAGGANSGEHSPVIHQIYQLDGVVTIDQHQGTGEGSEPQISVRQLIGAISAFIAAWNETAEPFMDQVGSRSAEPETYLL